MRKLLAQSWGSNLTPKHRIITHRPPSEVGMRAPTVSRIAGWTKRAMSMWVGYSIWKKSFHDHIIPNETDYIPIAEYIENNPAKWE